MSESATTTQSLAGSRTDSGESKNVLLTNKTETGSAFCSSTAGQSLKVELSGLYK